MMKRIITFISVLLSLCMAISAVPFVSAASDADARYEEAIVQRYEDSFEDSDYYSRLVSEGYTYYYKIWASNCDDHGALTKGYLWCVNKIMGTELDTLAYVDYLSKLMEMLDQSYVNFIGSQAEYTEKLTLEDYADETGKIAVKAFVGAAKFDEIEKAFAAMGAMKDLTDVGERLIEDEKEIAVLSVATANYEKKLAVLQAIYDNTEDYYLKEAAEIKMRECDMKYIYVASECMTDIVKTVAEVQDEFFELEVLQHIADSVAEGFTAWAKEEVGEKIGSTVGVILTYGAKYIGLIAVGAEIGVAISKMTMGDKYELFREAMAMDEISTALIKEMKSLKSEADSSGKYSAVRDYVYIGGALAYVHARGEYCDANCRRGPSKGAAKAAYNITAAHLGECVGILTDILNCEENVLTKNFSLYDGFIVEVEKQTSVPEGYVGIYDFDDLLAARENLDQNYILMADISCGPYETVYDSLQNYNYSDEMKLMGDFDGNGYTISNVRDPLFAATGEISVKNLGIEVNANITKGNVSDGTLGQYGAFAYLGAVEFDNCFVKGIITAQAVGDAELRLTIGGLIGEGKSFLNCYSSVDFVVDITQCGVGGLAGSISNGDIYNCYSDGDVSVSTKYDCVVGGLAGGVDYGTPKTIKYCYNKGDISITSESGSSVGGILGIVTGYANKAYTPITYCYNLGSINVNSKCDASSFSEIKDYTTWDGLSVYDVNFVARSYTGGIVGVSYQKIENCTNSGSITSTQIAGGIVGDAYNRYIDTAYFTDLLNTGTVKGDIVSAGIVGVVGEVTARFTRCCSFGDLENGEANGIFVGFFDEYPVYENSYYLAEEDDISADQLSTADSVTALDSSELYDKESYEGFDWNEIWYFDEENSPFPINLRY